LSLAIPVCAACGAAAFPPRALCPRCGSREWSLEDVASGVVEGVTERDGTRIAEVRTPLGPLVIVRLAGESAPGQHVALGLDGSAPVASPISRQADA
jgi:uncharacterized OB-fold protein